MVANDVPHILKQGNISVHLLSPDEYFMNAERIKRQTGNEIYHEDPDLCCQLLKVTPARHIYQEMNLKAWISGLRNTEGHTRRFINERETRTRSEAEAKINPLLKWDESEIWKYLAENDIPIHPWYLKRFPDGNERDGRWKGTIKSAGECGIHTQPLRNSQISSGC
jgi:phosphoadenosine phosphosulfate reductase